MIDYGDYIRLRSAMGSPSSTVEGYPCHLIRSSGKHLLNYSVCGNSSQIGVPSPSSPAEISSVGDLVTDEADANYGKYKIPIVVYGKNFLNCSMTADVYSPGISINNDLSITINQGYNNLSSPINIRQSMAFTIPSDNVIITASCKNASNEIQMIIRVKENVTDSFKYYTVTSKPETISLSKGAVVRVFLQIPSNGTISKPTTIYPQLELGDTATEYEPYIKPVITDIYLDAPLQRIGNHSDYIDFKRKVVVRNIKKYSIPSTMTWNSWQGANGTRLMIYQTSDKLYGNDITTLGYFNCGPVSQKMTYTSRSNTLCAYNLSSSCYWYADYTEMGLDGSESLDNANKALQSWLKSADAHFTYVLANPKEEKVSLPIIPTQKGNIFIATNTSIPASNISAKYSVKP